MSSKKIAIICDGKEISYGLNLLHLFQYKNEKKTILSSKFDDLDIDIYSTAAFKHASVSKKTIKIFVGVAQTVDNAYKKVFDRFGMDIFQKENVYVLKANEKQLSSYNDFLKYANERRSEYIDLEKQYFSSVMQVDKNWIVGEFLQTNFGGLFKKDNSKIQQLYDCMAFVVFQDLLIN